MAPLSSRLNKGPGFRSDYHPRPITHLMYMGDLKVYKGSVGELESCLGGVEEVSGAIGMELSLRKCGVAHMRAGKVVKRGTL